MPTVLSVNNQIKKSPGVCACILPPCCQPLVAQVNGSHVEGLGLSPYAWRKDSLCNLRPFHTISASNVLKRTRFRPGSAKVVFNPDHGDAMFTLLTTQTSRCVNRVTFNPDTAVCIHTTNCRHGSSAAPARCGGFLSPRMHCNASSCRM